MRLFGGKEVVFAQPLVISILFVVMSLPNFIGQNQPMEKPKSMEGENNTITHLVWKPEILGKQCY